jgi:hypothetical protein
MLQRHSNKRVNIFARQSSKPSQVYGQSGSGILSAIGAIAGAAYASKKYSPPADENARPAFPGEHHALLKLKGMKMGWASYMGPGTNIEARIARKDPPRTASDQVAQAHDLRYFKAKTPSDIQIADRKMIEALKGVRKKHGDSLMNILMGEKLIKAKMALLPKDAFGDLKNASNRVMTPAMDDKLEELEQAGLGKLDYSVASSTSKKQINALRKKMLSYHKRQ